MKSRSITICLALAVAIAASGAAGAQTKPPAPSPKAPAKPRATTPAQGGQAAGPSAAAKGARLRAPGELKETAPPTYNATFDTSAGVFVVKVHRDWAPKGGDRFYNAVKNGYYDGGRFFRVLPNFMVQFGINGTPSIQAAWRDANIDDDPVKQSNKRGYITFATSGPNSRTTQVFINFKDNAALDGQGFAPFGEVISGMEVVDKINAEYRERPDQGRIQSQGNAYLMKSFPNLTFIRTATITK